MVMQRGHPEVSHARQTAATRTTLLVCFIIRMTDLPATDRQTDRRRLLWTASTRYNVKVRNIIN